jgi:UDP-4-amino-4,6-dideoxy-N-acetyl-beta-L-altrosamine transaminase
MNNIPYGKHEISQSDIDSVVEVLRSDFLTQGPMVPAFEDAVANYCAVGHAIATSNATSALHIACLALGIKKGDLVWTSPITFVASANCALYCGASIDFVDIDPETYNISVAKLSDKLALAKIHGVLPKLIIPVHLSGHSCDMEKIYELSKQYGFKILEDASHAIGGNYQGEPVGTCRFSDITVFSFHPVKIITTGEGGMAVTNDESLARIMRLYRSHGITSSPEDVKPQSSKEIWNYQQIALGFNYRMTDIQAALGLSQMLRLDQFVVKRQAIAKRYQELLCNLPIVLPSQAIGCSSSFHLYVIRLKLDKIQKTHREVFRAIYNLGVLVNLHYIPVYRHPYYKNFGFEVGYCPEAERYYSEAISIPIYSGLTEQMQNDVVEIISGVLC